MKRIGRFLSAAAVAVAVLCSQAGCSNNDAEIRALRKEVAELREQVATQKGDTTWPNLAPGLTEPLEPKAAEPCTLENAMKASPRAMKIVEDRNKETQAGFDKEVGRMEAIKAEGDKLPPVPANLPPLPSGVLKIQTTLAEAVLDDATPKCDVNVNFSSEHGLAHEEPLTWSFLITLAQNSLRNLAVGKFSAYEAQVLMMTAEFIPWHWDEEGRLSKDVVMALRSVAENKATLKLFSDWLLKADTPLILQSTARSWIRDFWQASHANFTELEGKVKAEESEVKEGGEGEDWDRFRFLYITRMKREGWFMRRWINAGRGKAGDDMIRFYRTLMVDWARKLEMPEAAEWKKEEAKVMKK